MIVKKKSKQIIENKDDKEIEAFVQKGGATIEENIPLQKEKIFSLRLPEHLVGAIDHERKKCLGKFSRNNWIIEAIHEKLTNSSLGGSSK